MIRSQVTIAAVALACATALSACGESTSDAGRDTSTPHGYVEGAQEQAEAQSRLVYASLDGDRPRMLDLASEKTQPIGRRRDEPLADLSGDGRFVYLAPATGSGVRVLDSGVWTVEHGDHNHYYSAEPGELGPVRGIEPGSIAGSAAGAAVVFETAGEVVLLERKALQDGDIEISARLDVGSHAGVAVPYREHVIASTSRPGHVLAAQVSVFDTDGDQEAVLDTPCPDLMGQAVARTGVLFTCADGFLLVTEQDGTFAAEKIDYPAGTSPTDRATALHVRPGSNAVAGLSAAGVWTIDPSARRAALLDTDQSPVAVASPGDDRSVLLLRPDGVLESRDLNTGKMLHSRPVLTEPVAPSAEPKPVLEIDLARAYVNDPAGNRIVEVDYADDLRLARTFDTEVSPDFMVEVGR